MALIIATWTLSSFTNASSLATVRSTKNLIKDTTGSTAVVVVVEVVVLLTVLVDVDVEEGEDVEELTTKSTKEFVIKPCCNTSG